MRSDEAVDGGLSCMPHACMSSGALTSLGVGRTDDLGSYLRGLLAYRSLPPGRVCLLAAC